MAAAPGLHVLLAQTSQSLQDVLVPALATHNIRVEAVEDRAEALRLASQQTFHITVISADFGDGDGLSLGQRFAASYGHLILLIVDTCDDLVEAYELEADDYICAPVDVTEMMLRVLAMSRRITSANGSRYEVGPLALDAAQLVAWGPSGELELTATEFKLLRLLMERPGIAFTKSRIRREVWADGYVAPNTIERHVSTLRTKLRRCGARNVIQTVRGFGYKLRLPSGYAGPPSVIGGNGQLQH